MSQDCSQCQYPPMCCEDKSNLTPRINHWQYAHMKGKGNPEDHERYGCVICGKHWDVPLIRDYNNKTISKI